MKVQVLQENLQRGLNIVSRAVATRTTHPITANVLLSTDNGQLKLAATDLDISITTWIGAVIGEEGETTVPARTIGDLVSFLPAGTVKIEVPERGRVVAMECGRDATTINALDPEDFPRPGAVDDGIAIELDPAALKRAIDRVEFAAATDDSRPVLTGVHVRVDGAAVKLAAADGFRLAVSDLALTHPIGSGDGFEVIVPARAFRELGRLLGDTTQAVVMRVNGARTKVLFALTNVDLLAQLIQGTFPKYENLIPQAFTTKATIAVEDFRRETRMASIFARDGSGIVRLVFEPGGGGRPGELTVSAKAEEVGDNQGKIDAEIDGTDAKIAFNSRYLTDVLNAIDGKVVLELTSPSAQGVFRPVDDTAYVHVVMPMFVQW